MTGVSCRASARGDASGKKVYVQLKSGDSYLRERKSDGAEFFELKKERWAEYWQSLAYDVWLIIRTSDGRIRWMNATDSLRHATPDQPVRQIRFQAFDFKEVSVLQLRDVLLGLQGVRQPEDQRPARDKPTRRPGRGKRH